MFVMEIPRMVRCQLYTEMAPSRAANVQNTFSVFCWKNFHIWNNFSVSLNLFLIRLKTVIMATSYLLWWDPLAPSENSWILSVIPEQEVEGEHMLLPRVEERMNVLVIKEVFEGFKA